MMEIKSEQIKTAVYKLCFEANTCLNEELYSKFKEKYNSTKNQKLKNILKSILQNAKIAYEQKLPLCQDTGQVVVFLEIGQNVVIKGEYIEDVINSAVKSCYTDNFFRKSVVKNAVFDRANTNTNTPVIIHTQIIPKEEIRIKVLIKGAGSENKSRSEMLLPTADEDEIIKKIGDFITEAGVNSCPPMIVGVGIGGTAEKSALLAKKSLTADFFTKEEAAFSEKIKNYVNEKLELNYDDCYVLDVKALTFPTHIACLPVSVCINCHSDRYSSCTIRGEKIIYKHKKPDFIDIEDDDFEAEEIKSEDVEKIKNLKTGDNILLSGEVYVARDMAHKRLKEMSDSGETLPFSMKNKIIFYAGPCPNAPGKVIGSIGPTTAGRMDKYAPEFYDKGILATIGKGSRNEAVKDAIKRNGAKYFTVMGGVAALFAKKVIKKEIIAFEDLGAEALYRLEVKKLPLTVEIS